MPLFSLILSIVFLYIWYGDIKQGRLNKLPFRKIYASKFALKTFILITLSILATNFLASSPGVLRNEVFLILFSVLLSAGISTVWYKYLRRLDAFEPERKRYLFLAFFLSCITLFLVFPLSQFLNSNGFYLNGEPLNDFLYSVIGIGMIEEFTKLIPLLVILFFTKQIDEPIDFLIYAGMSALGFAFIENILYLESTSLSAVAGRLLYASVAHMFFAACIAYPLAIYRARTGRKFHLGILLMGYAFASLGHGFYDFWLINKALNIPILTTIFFLGSLQMFTIFNNNLINISNFYNPEYLINRSRLKYDLVWNILLVMYLGYFFFGLYNDSSSANALLLSNAIFHVSVVVYIGLTFSSFNFIKGYKIPVRFPWKVFLPKIDGYPDYTGLNLNLDLAFKGRKRPVKNERLSISGALLKRVVLEGDPNWYYLLGSDMKSYLIRARDFDRRFNKENYKGVFALEIHKPENAEDLIFTKKTILKNYYGLAIENQNQ